MKLNVYKTRNIQQIQKIQAHNKSVQDIAIINDQTNMIATCSGDKTIRIWNNSVLIATFIDYVNIVYSLYGKKV